MPGPCLPIDAWLAGVCGLGDGRGDWGTIGVWAVGGVGAGAMCVAGRAAAVAGGSGMAAFARIGAVASGVGDWSGVVGHPSEIV